MATEEVHHMFESFVTEMGVIDVPMTPPELAVQRRGRAQRTYDEGRLQSARDGFQLLLNYKDQQVQIAMLSHLVMLLESRPVTLRTDQEEMLHWLEGNLYTRCLNEAQAASNGPADSSILKATSSTESLVLYYGLRAYAATLFRLLAVHHATNYVASGFTLPWSNAASNFITNDLPTHAAELGRALAKQNAALTYQVRCVEELMARLQAQRANKVDASTHAVLTLLYEGAYQVDPDHPGALRHTSYKELCDAFTSPRTQINLRRGWFDGVMLLKRIGLQAARNADALYLLQELTYTQVQKTASWKFVYAITELLADVVIDASSREIKGAALRGKESTHGIKRLGLLDLVHYNQFLASARNTNVHVGVEMGLRRITALVDMDLDITNVSRGNASLFLTDAPERGDARAAPVEASRAPTETPALEASAIPSARQREIEEEAARAEVAARARSEARKAAREADAKAQEEREKEARDKETREQEEKDRAREKEEAKERRRKRRELEAAEKAAEGKPDDSTLADLQEKLRRALAALAEEEAAHGKTREALKASESRNKDQDRTLEALRKQLAQAEKERDAAQAELDALKDKYEDLNQQLKAEVRERTALAVLKKVATQQLKEQQDKLKQILAHGALGAAAGGDPAVFQEQLKDLWRSLDDERQQRHDLSLAKLNMEAQYKDENQRLKEERDALEDELRRIKENIDPSPIKGSPAYAAPSFVTPTDRGLHSTPGAARGSAPTSTPAVNVPGAGDARADAAEKEVDRLSGELRALRAVRDNLETELSDTRSRLSAMHHAVAEASGPAPHGDSARDKVEKDISDLKQNIRAATAVLNQLDQSLVPGAAPSAPIEVKPLSPRGKDDSVAAALASAQQTLAKLEAERGDLAGHIDAMRIERAILEQDIERLRQSEQALSADVPIKEALAKALADQQKAERTVAELQGVANQKERAAQSNADKLSEDLRAQQANNVRLASQLKTAEADRDKAATEQGILQAAVNDLNNQLAREKDGKATQNGAFEKEAARLAAEAVQAREAGRQAALNEAKLRGELADAKRTGDEALEALNRVHTTQFNTPITGTATRAGDALISAIIADQRRILELEAQVEAARADHGVAIEKATLAQAKVEHSVPRLERLQDENATMAGKLHAAEEALGKAQDAARLAEADHQAVLFKERAKAQAELDRARDDAALSGGELQAKLAALERDLDAALSRAQDAEAGIASVRAALGVPLVGDAGIAREQVAEALVRVAMLSAQRDAEAAELASMRDSLARGKDRIDALEMELVQANVRARDAEATLAQLVAAMGVEPHAGAPTAEDIAAALTNATSLRVRHDDAVAKAAAAEAQLATERQRAGDQKAQLEALRNQFEQMRRERDAAVAERATEKERGDKARTESDALSAQLHAALGEGRRLEDAQRAALAEAERRKLAELRATQEELSARLDAANRDARTSDDARAKAAKEAADSAACVDALCNTIMSATPAPTRGPVTENARVMAALARAEALHAAEGNSRSASDNLTQLSGALVKANEGMSKADARAVAAEEKAAALEKKLGELEAELDEKEDAHEAVQKSELAARQQAMAAQMEVGTMEGRATTAEKALDETSKQRAELAGAVCAALSVQPKFAAADQHAALIQEVQKCGERLRAAEAAAHVAGQARDQHSSTAEVLAATNADLSKTVEAQRAALASITKELGLSAAGADPADADAAAVNERARSQAAQTLGGVQAWVAREGEDRARRQAELDRALKQLQRLEAEKAKLAEANSALQAAVTQLEATNAAQKKANDALESANAQLQRERTQSEGEKAAKAAADIADLRRAVTAQQVALYEICHVFGVPPPGSHESVPTKNRREAPAVRPQPAPQLPSRTVDEHCAEAEQVVAAMHAWLVRELEEDARREAELEENNKWAWELERIQELIRAKEVEILEGKITDLAGRAEKAGVSTPQLLRMALSRAIGEVDSQRTTPAATPAPDAAATTSGAVGAGAPASNSPTNVQTSPRIMASPRTMANVVREASATRPTPQQLEQPATTTTGAAQDPAAQAALLETCEALKAALASADAAMPAGEDKDKAAVAPAPLPTPSEPAQEAKQLAEQARARVRDLADALRESKQWVDQLHRAAAGLHSSVKAERASRETAEAQLQTANTRASEAEMELATAQMALQMERTKSTMGAQSESELQARAIDADARAAQATQRATAAEEKIAEAHRNQSAAERKAAVSGQEVLTLMQQVEEARLKAEDNERKAVSAARRADESEAKVATMARKLEEEETRAAKNRSLIQSLATESTSPLGVSPRTRGSPRTADSSPVGPAAAVAPATEEEVVAGLKRKLAAHEDTLRELDAVKQAARDATAAGLAQRMDAAAAATHAAEQQTAFTQQAQEVAQLKKDLAAAQQRATAAEKEAAAAKAASKDSPTAAALAARSAFTPTQASPPVTNTDAVAAAHALADPVAAALGLSAPNSPTRDVDGMGELGRQAAAAIENARREGLAKASSMWQEMDRVNGELARAQEEVVRLRDANRALQKESRTAASDAAKQESEEVAALTAQIKPLRSELASVKDELARAKKTATRDGEGAKNEIARLSQELAGKRAEADSLRSEINTTRGDANTASDAAGKREGNLQAELARAKADLATTQAKLEPIEAELEAALMRLEGGRALSDAMGRERNELLERLEDAEDEHDALVTAHDAARQKDAAALASVTAERDALANERNRLLTAQNASASNRDASLSALTQELEALRKARSDAETQAGEAGRERDRLAAALEKATAEVKRLQGERAAGAAAVEKASTEKAQLEARVAQAEREVTAMRNAAQSAAQRAGEASAQDAAGAQHKIIESRDEADKLRGQLADAKSKIAAREAQLAEAETAIVQLETELNDTQQQMRLESFKVQSLQKALNGMNAELERATTPRGTLLPSPRNPEGFVPVPGGAGADRPASPADALVREISELDRKSSDVEKQLLEVEKRKLESYGNYMRKRRSISLQLAEAERRRIEDPANARMHADAAAQAEQNLINEEDRWGLESMELREIEISFLALKKAIVASQARQVKSAMDYVEEAARGRSTPNPESAAEAQSVQSLLLAEKDRRIAELSDRQQAISRLVTDIRASGVVHPDQPDMGRIEELLRSVPSSYPDDLPAALGQLRAQEGLLRELIQQLWYMNAQMDYWKMESVQVSRILASRGQDVSHLGINASRDIGGESFDSVASAQSIHYEPQYMRGRDGYYTEQPSFTVGAPQMTRTQSSPVRAGGLGGDVFADADVGNLSLNVTTLPAQFNTLRARSLSPERSASMTLSPDRIAQAARNMGDGRGRGRALFGGPWGQPSPAPRVIQQVVDPRTAHLLPPRGRGRGMMGPVLARPAPPPGPWGWDGQFSPMMAPWGMYNRRRRRPRRTRRDDY